MSDAYDEWAQARTHLTKVMAAFGEDSAEYAEAREREAQAFAKLWPMEKDNDE